MFFRFRDFAPPNYNNFAKHYFNQFSALQKDYIRSLKKIK